MIFLCLRYVERWGLGGHVVSTLLRDYHTSSISHLNCLSSSITCTPCSYCSWVAGSPDIGAKCPLTVKTDGEVGYRALTRGLEAPPFVPFSGRVDMSSGGW